MKNVFILSDFSHRSEHAAEIALKIAEKTNSKVIFFNAYMIPQLVPAVTSGNEAYKEYQDIELKITSDLQRFAEKVSNKVYKHRHESIPEFSCINMEGPLTGSVTSFLKHKSNIWLIIMGDKGGKKGFFNQVVNESDCMHLINESVRPVLLIPEKARFRGIDSIVLATTLEKTDYKPLKVLLELGKHFDSKITLVHICKERLSLEQKVRNIDLLNKIKAKLHYPEISYEDVTGEEVSATLAKFASAEKVDLLSIIHKRHHLLNRFFFNSTTEEMLQNHKIPLMVFPPGFG